MSKESKLEYKFLNQVIARLEKENWIINDLKDLYKEYEKFLKNMKIDELSSLRIGEILLGKLCNTEYKEAEDAKNSIYTILSSMEELEIPSMIVMIGAILKISIAQIENNTINFMNVKKEGED